MSDSRRQIVRSAAAGVFVGLLALAGQWSSGLASWAVLTSPLVHVALLVLIAQMAWRLWKNRSARPQLIGIGAALGAELALAALFWGVPRWVKARSTPAIAALEEWKVAHGDYPGVQLTDSAFPEEIRALLARASCMLYVPRVGAYEITCRGVPFTKCSYDSATRDWTAWD
jgi:hypothetical protein